MSILFEFCKWEGFWTFNSRKKKVKGVALGWVVICVFQVSVIENWNKAILGGD